MHNCVAELPSVGAIISYILLPKDSPVEPDREWKGKVIKVYTKTPGSLASVKVESLEEGHEGLTETVLLSQIVSIVTV